MNVLDLDILWTNVFLFKYYMRWIKATNRKISSGGKILHCQHIKKGPDIQLAWEYHRSCFFWMLNFSERRNQKAFSVCERIRFIQRSLLKRLFKTINVFIGNYVLTLIYLNSRFVMHSGLWSLSLKHCLLFHYSTIHLQITIHQNLFLATETMPFIWERTLFWQIK